MRSVFLPSSSRHQPEVIREEVSIERKQSCVYGIFFDIKIAQIIPPLHYSTSLALFSSSMRGGCLWESNNKGVSFKNRFILKDFFKKNLCIQFLLRHNAYYVCLVQCCHLLLKSLFAYSGLCNTHSTVTTENTLGPFIRRKIRHVLHKTRLK